MNTIVLVPMADIERMAQAVAKSGLFGVKTVEQALALMLVAQAEGRHPALAARDYDIIQGRPAKKAEAMLRDFLESGGKVEWHTLDDTVADATFSHPSGGTARIDWTMARAVAAGLGGREMWKKYPRQMLRSRVVSEGIRTVCPMATSGMYVPEEVIDIVKEKDITPRAGVADRLNEEQHLRVKEVVDKIMSWLNDGAIGDAVAEMDNAALDADESVYAWGFFSAPHRKAMKAESARVRAAQAMVARETISTAQHKRLEAIIKERGLDREEIKTWCLKEFGVKHLNDLSREEYDILDKRLPEAAAAQATVASLSSSGDAPTTAAAQIDYAATPKSIELPADKPTVVMLDKNTVWEPTLPSATPTRVIDKEIELRDRANSLKVNKSAFLELFKVASFEKLASEHYEEAKQWLDKKEGKI